MKRRILDFEVRALQPPDGGGEMAVEGRAVVFDTPTVLFESGGVEYKEQISRSAFDGCDMTDVVFLYNHDGAVMARTRNGTLALDIRPDGLYIRADIGGTAAGRELHEQIRGGYIDRMSFSFVPSEEDWNEREHLWTVKRIKRLYDVSAVSMPAYEDTSISARRQQMAESETRNRRRRLTLRTRL